MAFITHYQHDAFIRRLDTSIKKMEEQAPHEKGAQLLMAELENDAVLLEQLYIRLHSVAKELRDLAGDYQQIQKNNPYQVTGWAMEVPAINLSYSIIIPSIQYQIMYDTKKSIPHIPMPVGRLVISW